MKVSTLVVVIIFFISIDLFSQSTQIEEGRIELVSTKADAVLEITKEDTTVTNNYSAFLIRDRSHGVTNGISVIMENSGSAARFNTSSTSNQSSVFISTEGSGSGLNSHHSGTGSAANFQISNVTSTANTIESSNSALGSAGDFIINNVINPNSAISTYTNGTGHALNAQTIGSGSAGRFIINNYASQAFALMAQSNTNGGAIKGESTSSAPSIVGEALGTNNTAIYGFTNSLEGMAGHFKNTNSSNTTSALLVETLGTGSGIWSKSWDEARASIFQNLSLTNSTDVILSQNRGLGNSIFAQIDNESNGAAAFFAQTNGTGNVIVANHLGSGASSTSSQNNLALFKAQGFNKARIDIDGKAYFNGGTQNSGADLAEAFKVENEINEYEAGDVLIISTKSDRKVEKSAKAYSRLVAGVYATKPGLLLTEENIDSDLSDHIPMGVIGVIPTKVCNEGGAIKRGDLLVTSSTAGHAMKADLSKVSFGQILGKALANMNSETGIIKVLVSVK